MQLLPTTNRPLRDYQQLCVEHTLHTLERGEHSLSYVLPTGGGKTRVAAALIEKLAPQFDCILFLAHRKELIYQTAKSFQEDIAGLNVGICMGQQKELSADLIVGTIQTVSRGSLQYLLERRTHVLCFIDEAHHVTSDNAYGTLIAAIRNHNSENVILGCTATPYRADNKPGLQAVIPTCSFHRSIEDLQSAGYLAPTTWLPVHVDVRYDDCKLSTKDGEQDFRSEELSTILFPTIPQIVEKTIPLIEKRPTVVFAPSVDFAKRLADAYNEKLMGNNPLNNLIDSPAACIWGDMPKADREWILERWKLGAIQIVTNVGVLTEGFDFPGIAAIVNTRPTQSPGLYMQMIGRGTRIKSGKYPDCRIIDVCGNANLLETRQIVLPKILEAISERDEQIMSDPALLDRYIDEFGIFNAPEDMEQAIKDEKKERTYKILDPLSRSWIAWGREVDYYYASLGNGAIALAKKTASSGLWMGYVLSQTEKDEQGRHLWKKQTISRTSTTLNSIMQHLNHIIASNGVLKLVDKEAKWRERPASEKALKYLWVLDHAEGDRAKQHHWTAGYVGLRITFHQVKNLVGRL